MPDNWIYMWAAYTVAAIVLVGYTALLAARVRRERAPRP